MEEQKEQLKLYSFLQMSVYFFVLLDISINVYLQADLFGPFSIPLERLGTTFLFDVNLHTKLFTLLIVCLVGIGTLARKTLNQTPKTCGYTAGGWPRNAFHKHLFSYKGKCRGRRTATSSYRLKPIGLYSIFLFRDFADPYGSG